MSVTFPQLPVMDHIGLVVEKLESSMTVLTEVMGLHWADPITVGGEMDFRGTMLPWQCRVTYSIEGPVHLELIQQVDSRRLRDTDQRPICA